jgi:oxygen-independent coproporphyrinogen-3 oxidase
MPLPDPDVAADMYEWAGETLEAAGYQQYEISNWARTKDETIHPSSFILPPSYACRHNLQYWRGLPYLAAGAGAHGYVNGYRYSNVLRIKTYIDRLANYQLPSKDYEFPLTPATVNHHLQSTQDDMGEFMLTGLRLTREGVSAGTFREHFGQEMNAVFGAEIEDLVRLGLLEWVDFPLPMGRVPEGVEGLGEVPGKGMRIRLTRRGRLLGNQAFIRFVA